jgi:5'-nucleotidase
LWAAAEALSALGYVTVAAPREQSSGMGRSVPLTSEGTIQRSTLQIGGREWPVFSIGGTPSQSVQHAVLEILEQKPDLVVSGINYGENLGSDITLSGTVGAAMEGAALGIRALAVSLQIVKDEDFYSLSHQVDFASAAWFTRFFAEKLLRANLPTDVDLLNVVVPHGATPQTAWKVTRLAHHGYFIPYADRQGEWEEPGRISARPETSREHLQADTDIHAMLSEQLVSVTPLSLDFTSRIPLADFEQHLRSL